MIIGCLVKKNSLILNYKPIYIVTNVFKAFKRLKTEISVPTVVLFLNLKTLLHLILNHVTMVLKYLQMNKFLH